VQDDFNEWLHLALKLWSDYSAAEMQVIYSTLSNLQSSGSLVTSTASFFGMTLPTEALVIAVGEYFWGHSCKFAEEGREMALVLETAQECNLSNRYSFCLSNCFDRSPLLQHILMRSNSRSLKQATKVVLTHADKCSQISKLDLVIKIGLNILKHLVSLCCGSPSSYADSVDVIVV